MSGAPRAAGRDALKLVSDAGNRLIGALSQRAADPTYDERVSKLWTSLCVKANAVPMPSYGELAKMASGGQEGRLRLLSAMRALDERFRPEVPGATAMGSRHHAAVAARDAWAYALGLWDRVAEACGRGDLEAAFSQEIFRAQALRE